MQLSQVLDAVLRDTRGERISIAELLKLFKNRSYGAGLLLLALVTLFPLTGGIPGFPIITGVAIALLSVQLLFLRRHPWLPQKIAHASVERRSLEQLVNRFKPWVVRVEPVLGERLTIFVDPPFTNIVALLCLGLSVLFIPLGFIPFGVAAPAAALTLLALGLVVRDGVVVLIGFAGTGAAAWFAYSLLV